MKIGEKIQKTASYIWHTPQRIREKKALRTQIKQLECDMYQRQAERKAYRDFELSYTNTLPTPIVSDKALSNVERLQNMIRETCERVRKTQIDHGHGFTAVTEDCPAFEIHKTYKDGSSMVATRRDSFGTRTTDILTINFYDKNGERKEAIRVVSNDVDYMSWKKGQVKGYENTKNDIAYRRDPLYPNRRFYAIEEQVAGHPLVMKRINHLLSTIFTKE